MPRLSEGSMDDKDKSLLDKFIEKASEAIGIGHAKPSDAPIEELDPSRIAGEANEQMYMPDMAAVPAPIIRQRRLPKRANKRAAAAHARKAKAPKKVAKKATRKAAKRAVPKKSKSSAGRKAVGRKKVADSNEPMSKRQIATTVARKKTTAAKRAAKPAGKKASKRGPPKKTKSSAGRKAVGRRKPPKK